MIEMVKVARGDPRKHGVCSHSPNLVLCGEYAHQCKTPSPWGICRACVVDARGQCNELPAMQVVNELTMAFKGSDEDGNAILSSRGPGH